MHVAWFSEILDEKTFGGKAANLSLMLRNQFPVPNGFALSKSCYEARNNSEFQLEIQNNIELALGQLSATHVMVRSSAIGEDDTGHSFAGQLSSFLCENKLEDVLNHVQKCWDSYNENHVSQYAAQANKTLGGMGVVIQELINPEYAGVIFTRSHIQDHCMLVEYVKGHGEQLVSGEVNPFRFHFHLKHKIIEGETHISFDQAIKLAIQLEDFYRKPIDIEWAYSANTFYIVQARPITTSIRHSAVFWSNTNVNENYPEALSPMLYSIARQAYYHYFKNLAHLFQVPQHLLASLEKDLQNIIGVFGGKMYYNMSSIHAVLSSSPFSALLIASFDNFVGYAEGNKAPKKAANWKDKLRFLRTFLKLNRKLPIHVEQFENRADDFFLKANSAKTQEELEEAFLEFIEIRLHSWYHASLADFFAMAFHGFLGKLCSKYFPEEAHGIQNQLIQAIPNLVSSEPVISMHEIAVRIKESPELFFSFKHHAAELCWKEIQLPQYSSIFEDVTAYLENYGFRCSGELMLTTVNYCENPISFIALLKQLILLETSHPQEKIHLKYLESLQCRKKFRKKITSKNALNPFKLLKEYFLFNYVVRKTCEAIASRERVRLKQAKIYFGLKKILTQSGIEFEKQKQLKNADDILFMTYPELIEMYAASAIAPSSISTILANRMAAWKKESELLFPDDFYTERGKYSTPEIVAAEIKQMNHSADLTGLCACGGLIDGKIKVLASIHEAHKLEAGDILVTRQTDPGWVTVFPLISGLIVERGGMLSHGAVVSREFGIPAIVGVPEATKKLKDNDFITLNAFQGTIVIHHDHI
jgi:phosphohistidine swiveling domain-containing protein